MARRRGLSKRPIVTSKEIVDGVFFIVAGGVTTDIDLATAVNTYIGSVGTVPIGGKLLGFFLEVSVANVDIIVGRTDWFLCKRNSGTVAASFPAPGATGGSILRKYIYHEEKGLFTNPDGNTAGGQTFRTKQFIAIPRGAQRMGEGDVWTIRAGSSENYSFCIKCIYKWYQ